VADVIEDVRRRDAARFELQLAEGIRAGQRFLKGNIGTPIPTPLAQPRRPGQALNEETAGVLHKSTPANETRP
jgi:glutathione-regulated potassium-efflux system protein KefB